jgi:hypothetical protein
MSGMRLIVYLDRVNVTCWWASRWAVTEQETHCIFQSLPGNASD